MFPSYKYHIFICQNERPDGHPLGCCASKGSADLLVYMKQKAKELGIEGIRINKAGCLNACENGPAMVMYPAGQWFCLKSKADVDQILNDLVAR